MGIRNLVVCLTLASGLQAIPQNPAQDHNAHHCEMMQRGDQAMGFSHENTTHHFRLFKNGGEIAVVANDAKDSTTVSQIRDHLTHIAKLFSAGNFDVPMFIHDTTPPGAATMEQLKGQIRYQLVETDRGARVRITTASPQATDAVHAFLLFQMADHQTGDSPKIVEEQ
jgi:hypothetical protein